MFVVCESIRIIINSEYHWDFSIHTNKVKCLYLYLIDSHPYWTGSGVSVLRLSSSRSSVYTSDDTETQSMRSKKSTILARDSLCLTDTRYYDLRPLPPWVLVNLLSIEGSMDFI